MKNPAKSDMTKEYGDSATRNPNYADLGVLYDGTGDEDEDAGNGDAASALRDANRPTPEAQPPKPTPAAVPEVIYPHQYRLRTEFDYKPGEDGWGYLDRITPHLLKELVAMATAPVSVINAKVKLDALKELIQRPMPARQVYDIRTPQAGSEFDRMSDAQVMDFVHKQIADMRKEELATPPDANTPTPDPASVPTQTEDE
jgi:hypothetical protein